MLCTKCKYNANSHVSMCVSVQLIAWKCNLCLSLSGCLGTTLLLRSGCILPLCGWHHHVSHGILHLPPAGLRLPLPLPAPAPQRAVPGRSASTPKSLQPRRCCLSRGWRWDTIELPYGGSQSAPSCSCDFAIFFFFFNEMKDWERI